MSATKEIYGFFAHDHSCTVQTVNSVLLSQNLKIYSHFS